MEMATHSSVLAWRIPGMGDLALAAAAAAAMPVFTEVIFQFWEVTVHGGIPQLLKVKML